MKSAFVARYMPIAVFLVLAAVSVAKVANIYLGQTVINDSEVYSLANPSIEYALHNKLQYPLVNHGYYVPGIDNLFVLHPPLYYVMVGLVIKLCGVGVWQINFVGTIAILAIVLAAAFWASRWHGWSTACVVLALFILFPDVEARLQQVRCNYLVGFWYALMVVILCRTWASELNDRVLAINSFVMGVLAVAAFASHWNGVFAFMALPLYWLIVVLRGKQWLRHALLLAAGSLCAFVPWDLFYRVNGYGLWNILHQLAVLNSKAQELPGFGERSILTTIEPLLATASGRLIGFGLFLVALVFLGRLFRIVRARNIGWPGFQPAADSSERMARVEFMLAMCCLLYLVFEEVCVGNKQQRNLVVIYFPVFILSARGFVIGCRALWQGAPKARTAWKFSLVLLAILLMAMVVSITPSPAAAAFRLMPSGSVLRFPDGNPNRLYDTVRSVMNRFVPKERRVIMGTQIHHFLPAHNYITSCYIETAAAAKKGARSIDLYGVNLARAERRDLLRSGGEILVIPDEFEFLENKMFDQRIWEMDFKKAAVVYHPADQATAHITHGRWYSSLYPVLYRNDVSADLFRSAGFKPNTVGCSNGVVWIVFDPANDAPTGITGREWHSMSASDKDYAIHSYMESHSWFGLDGLENSPGAISGFRDHVDSYFALHDQFIVHMKNRFGYSEDEVRSLEQAMDDVLAKWLVRNCVEGDRISRHD